MWYEAACHYPILNLHTQPRNLAAVVERLGNLRDLPLKKDAAWCQAAFRNRSDQSEEKSRLDQALSLGWNCKVMDLREAADVLTSESF